jgi:predicted RNA-binding Zn-ribbon protein involved in translation (DUF1610 family)
MITQGLIFKKNPLYEKCPSCSAAGTLRKSRPRKTVEKIVRSLTPYGPYRCKKCGWRGYRSRLVLTTQSVKNGILYLLMVAFSAFIVYQILKRFV